MGSKFRRLLSEECVVLFFRGSIESGKRERICLRLFFMNSEKWRIENCF